MARGLRGASSSSESAGTDLPARAAERAEPAIGMGRGGRPGVAARARACPEQPHSPAVPTSDSAPSVLIDDWLFMISGAAADEPWLASRSWRRSSSSESDLRTAADGLGHEGPGYAFPADGTTRLERTSRRQPSDRGSLQDVLLVSLSPSIEGLSDVTVR